MADSVLNFATQQFSAEYADETDAVFQKLFGVSLDDCLVAFSVTLLKDARTLLANESTVQKIVRALNPEDYPTGFPSYRRAALNLHRTLSEDAALLTSYSVMQGFVLADIVKKLELIAPRLETTPKPTPLPEPPPPEPDDAQQALPDFPPRQMLQGSRIVTCERRNGVLIVSGKRREKIISDTVPPEAAAFVSAYNAWCDDPTQTLTALASRFQYTLEYASILANRLRKGLNAPSSRSTTKTAAGGQRDASSTPTANSALAPYRLEASLLTWIDSEGAITTQQALAVLKDKDLNTPQNPLRAARDFAQIAGFEWAEALDLDEAQGTAIAATIKAFAAAQPRLNGHAPKLAAPLPAPPAVKKPPKVTTRATPKKTAQYQELTAAQAARVEKAKRELQSPSVTRAETAAAVEEFLKTGGTITVITPQNFQEVRDKIERETGCAGPSTPQQRYVAIRNAGKRRRAGPAPGTAD